MTEQSSYDYIVVGAGTTGCILANRLSQDKQNKVLLIEAGDDPKSFWIDMPAGVSKLIFPGKFNWGFNTQPEPHLNNRSIYAPRGRGLGGSSLINGMAYFKGQPEDFNAWENQGCIGWGWKDISYLYALVEKITSDGTGLSVTPPKYVHPASNDFVTASHQIGAPLNPNFNTSTTDGAGIINFSIKDGTRHSAYKAFIEPIRNSRPNLEIITGADAQKILWQGRQAVGIEVINQGQLKRLQCRGEVILAAGAFGSPKLLMQSGVGNGEQLQAHGIELTHHLPGVGENLQDHMYIHHTYACDNKSSLNADFRGVNAMTHGINYVLRKKGPLTSGASQAVAFVRSSENIERPDLQICYRPVSWVFDQHGTMEIGKTPEMTVSVCNLRPTSRGRVSLCDDWKKHGISIYANYLSTDNDQEVAIRSVKKVRSIFQKNPLSSRVTSEVSPGISVKSDLEILDYVRGSAQSMHHWAGTCKMGIDEKSVVDSQLRVYGTKNLRVADASIIPNIVSANTNAVSYVIGEKAAQMILSSH